MATFANPEGMKDCFYVPDPFVDLKNVGALLISAGCVTVPFLLRGFACRHLQTTCLHADPSIQGMVLQELDKKLPKCPVEVGTFPHWLIINGKQPAIPENAVIDRRQPPAKRRKVASRQKTGKALLSHHELAI